MSTQALRSVQHQNLPIPHLEDVDETHFDVMCLTSMRERVRLLNGTISIESKPMGETTIHVRVPLGWSEHAAKQEAV